MANINFDEGTIQLDNEWYAVEGLKNKIADMLAAGNYKITSYSRVLEELDEKMEGAETISAVLPAKTLDGLKKIATNSSKSMGDFVREALTAYLRS